MQLVCSLTINISCIYTLVYLNNNAASNIADVNTCLRAIRPQSIALIKTKLFCVIIFKEPKAWKSYSVYVLTQIMNHWTAINTAIAANYKSCQVKDSTQNRLIFDSHCERRLQKHLNTQVSYILYTNGLYTPVKLSTAIMFCYYLTIYRDVAC